jgi:DNA polymerase-1
VHNSGPKPKEYPPVPSSRPLLIVDGDSFAHRAYHALPKTIRRAGNRGGGAIVGFTNYLLRLYEAEKPRAVVIGWDTLAEPNWRALELEGYQGGRVFEDEIVDQLDVLPEFMAAFGFVNGKAAGFEADDFLATAVAMEEKRGGTALVASGDRDAFQLVSEKTTVLHPKKAGEIARVDRAGVRAWYGIDPHQVPDFIALRGDPSDRIPGAKGVGEKTAASLLQRYPTLDAMLADGKFPTQVENLKLYKRIATMVPDAPLKGPIPDMTPDWAKAAALAKDWDLNALSERLAKLAAQ